MTGRFSDFCAESRNGKGAGLRWGDTLTGFVLVSPLSQILPQRDNATIRPIRTIKNSFLRQSSIIFAAFCRDIRIRRFFCTCPKKETLVWGFTEKNLQIRKIIICSMLKLQNRQTIIKVPRIFYVFQIIKQSKKILRDNSLKTRVSISKQNTFRKILFSVFNFICWI